MKLKKSLLALSTAAAVTVAGIPAATAQTAGSGDLPGVLSSLDQKAGENTDAPADENEGGDDTTPEQPEEPAEQGFMGSVDGFFGWDEDTSGVDKIKAVGTLLGAIVAIISGITGLAGAVEKLGKIGR